MPHQFKTPLSRTAEHLEPRYLLTGEPVITQNGSVVIVVGQATDDVVELQLGDQEHLLDFSGHQYSFDANEVNEIRIGGGFGNNSIVIRGTDLDDRGQAIGLTGSLTSSAYTALSFSFQETTLVGGSGNDYAEIYGSNEADSLQGLPESSVLVTPSTVLIGEDFERVDAYGRGGNDVGQIYGTQESDTLVALDAYVALFGAGIDKVARGFERIDGFGRGGDDFARLFDSSTDDVFVSNSEFAYLQTPSRLSYAKGFEDVEAIGANGGNDQTVFFANSDFVETFTAEEDTVTMVADGLYSRYVENFDSHNATSFGSQDIARVAASVANDTDVSGFAVVETIGPVSPASEFDLFLESLKPFFSAQAIDEIAAKLTETRTTVGLSNDADDFVGTATGEQVFALDGNDEIFAQGGNDLVRAGDGNDRVDTNDQNDIAFGGAGNDEIKGGRGNDILLGGAGNDIVDGEEGLDIVSGGSGNDLFRFISLDETVIITDFNIAEDRIELINMDAADITTGTEFGSLTINHPEGLNIVLLGIDSSLTVADLNVTFVTSETQTLFDPNA